jgi:hypothetical protein
LRFRNRIRCSDQSHCDLITTDERNIAKKQVTETDTVAGVANKVEKTVRLLERMLRVFTSSARLIGARFRAWAWDRDTTKGIFV